MAITINGGVQFTGGFTSIGAPSLNINNDIISIKDNTTMTTTTYNFTDVVDFTRASAATYVGSNGYVTTTPTSKNLITYTQEINSTRWSAVNNVSSLDNFAAPNGTNTATQLTFGTGATNWLSKAVSVVLNAGDSITFSSYMRADTETSGVRFFLSGTTPIFNNYFSTIFTVGTTWARYSATYTATSTVTISGVGFRNENKTIYTWGAQAELGAVMTSYTRNYGSVYPPRFDYDPVTLQPKGFLVEEQRTNLLIYSEDFTQWSQSSVTASGKVASPAGTSTADVMTASSISGFFYKNAAFTGDGDKAFSIFIKAGTSPQSRITIRDTTVSINRGDFTISWSGGVPTISTVSGSVLGTDTYQSGWYRVRLLAVGVVAANSNQFRILPDSSSGTGNSIYWGAQTENGAFATSYIPTVASTVTRSPDIAAMSGAIFSSWYNQSEGTMVAKFSSFSPSLSQCQYSVSDGTNNNRWFVYINSVTVRHLIITGGVSQTNISVGAYAENAIYTSAFALKLNTVQAAVNGVLGIEDTTATLPAVDRLYIGSGPAGASNYLNGHIRSIVYYPYRLTNAQIQSLTA